MYKVSDFDCPETWDPGGVFVGLHPQEAIWLSFGHSVPLAVLVGAGGVNALTGDPLALALSPGGYMVAPPQPWIDGWKDADTGTVFQFVATRFEGGKGLSVGEQLIGEESKSGGIGIAVFESSQPLRSPVRTPTVSSWGDALPTKGMMTMGEPATFGGSRRSSLSGHEMAVGKGGAIKQRIYPDPHGIEVWKKEPSATGAVYLVDAQAFHDITGEELAPSPISSEGYGGQYFSVDDDGLGDVQGSDKFIGLKSVFAADQ